MAQFFLGRAFARGEGVPRDDARAVELYRKAAEQGHAKAQNNPGSMFVQGLGVTRDETEAAKWSRRAAEQGSEKGQRRADEFRARKRTATPAR